MVCKLCGQEKNLVKAHVIPRSFYDQVSDPQSGALVLSNASGKYPYNIHSGIYDRTIVCNDCESKFSTPDDYAKRFFRDQVNSWAEIVHEKDIIGYEVESFDYSKLKMFFISTMWRASVSQQDIFKRVSLGPFENVAKSMILSNYPGSEEEFSVVIQRYEGEIKIIFDPYFIRDLKGANFYKMYLPGFAILIKVDQRKTPEELKHFQLRDGTPLVVLSRQLTSSKDFNVARTLIRHNRDKVKIRDYS